jgi:hypothetical protein
MLKTFLLIKIILLLLIIISNLTVLLFSNLPLIYELEKLIEFKDNKENKKLFGLHSILVRTLKDDKPKTGYRFLLEQQEQMKYYYNLALKSFHFLLFSVVGSIILGG